MRDIDPDYVKTIYQKIFTRCVAPDSCDKAVLSRALEARIEQVLDLRIPLYIAE